MSCLGLSRFRKAKSKKTLDISKPVVDNSGSEENYVRPTSNSTAGPCKLFAGKEKSDDKLVAVVVTISNGSSYDEMFREHQPATVLGERVSTYSLDSCKVRDFYQYLSGTWTVASHQVGWRQLIDDISQVAADSVTFNWECCSGCSDSSFPCCNGSSRRPLGRLMERTMSMTSANPAMNLMGLALRKGFTVMCSDFSLKALIAEWSEEQLGPNPFVKMGSCSDQFQLEFLPEDLKNEEVPQQLQVVGELCAEQGKAVVTAMSDTIVYTVNPRRSPTDLYRLKILTVVGDYDGRGSLAQSGDDDLCDQSEFNHCEQQLEQNAVSVLQNSSQTQQKQNRLPEAMMCSVGEGDKAKRGMAGHVTLTYKSGGQLVTSMGHWIELTRIDTSLDGVLRVARRNFGMHEMETLQAEMDLQTTDYEREECVQTWAKNHISKSVPSRMKCRTKFEG